LHCWLKRFSPAGGRAARLDYSSRQRAITIFTHSLSQAWAEEGIRVNSVAPGAILDDSYSIEIPPGGIWHKIDRFFDSAVLSSEW
jgi:NAD(P)-dependent dehydrogenase (short-subunit alcohol dehydrogenase family)